MTKQLPPLNTMLSELIRTHSVSSVIPSLDHGNLEVSELISNWLEPLGFRVELIPLLNDPKNANVVATIGEGAGGLVLAGHTDTVPFDEAKWNVNPLAATERDGLLYGLGTSDMKSFFALALAAAKSFQKRDFRRPLVILATADEESGMAGARALLDAGKPLGRHALIGEPTEMLPVRLNKGIIMEAIHITGRSGHSSNPALGNNALDGMHRVIGELMKLREELALQHHDPAFNVPSPTLNLGHIHGGDNANRICGNCELHIDLRLVPGMQVTQAREVMRQRVSDCLADSGLQVSFDALFDGADPLHTPATAEIVRCCENLTGHTAGSVDFTTEGPYLNGLGMETVILGPGSISCAHQPDEHLDLQQVEPTIALLKQLIHRFCISPENALDG